MKKQYLIIEHRNSNAFNSMKNQVVALRGQLSNLSRRYSELETLYCSEIAYNNALCDILRDHNIPFREVFSSEYRAKIRGF